MKADDLSSVTQSRLDFISVWSDTHSGVIGDDMDATPPLHGRDSEKLVLIEAYQRLLETQEPKVVFVHGTSGQGKTSLVDTLREHVVDSGGYFCAGKFFQDSRIQEPFSAITSAFSDLCDLVVQSPDFDERSGNRIRDHLALDGHLLSRFVNLTPFLSRDSMDLYSTNKREKVGVVTFARFRAACKAFLLAMATKKHPVVLFVDDLQWLDSGSAKLIETLIIDNDIENVMFIFSYRDEEASAVADIVQSADTKRRVVDIQLSNLDLKGVRQILAWRLEPMTDNIEALSELTFQRTGGNPFFVSLFLDAIATEEYVSINEVSPTFDVDEIRSSIMVADSIAALLSQKVCRLPMEIRHALTIASLMGYSFDEKMLFDIFKTLTGKERQEEMVAMLTLAVDEGFIEKAKGSYQFTHDKLQKAFQDLVDEPARDRLHQVIGERYLAQGSNGSIYNAAVHLNVAPGFLYCPEQVIVLAQINLNASRCCQQLSAFDRALFFVRTGIEVLDKRNMKWSPEVRVLSLELTESLARVSLLVGDFDMCDEATGEAMLHADTKERKVNILLINAECRMAKNEMKASIRVSTKALSELGVKLPRKATMRHVAFKFMKLNYLMAGKTDEYILELPPVQDESWAVAIRLLMHICFYATLIDDEPTAAFAAFTAMNLTLKHGLSAYAGSALSIFGAAVSYMGNVERAYNLGKLALKLAKKSPSQEGDCSTLAFVYTTLLHWKEPIFGLRDPLVSSATAGFEKGDVIYSTYSLSQALCMDIHGGVHLEDVERFLRSQYGRMQECSQNELLQWISPFMQCVTNLRSSRTDWSQLSLLSGTFMNPSRPLSGAASGNIIVATTALMQQLLLATVFGFHHMARGTLQALEPFEHLLQGAHVFNLVCWEAGAAYYESYITDGNRKHLRKARKYRKYLVQRNALGPNAAAFLKHLNLQRAFFFLRRRKKTGTDVSRDDETLRSLDRELDTFSLSESSCTPCFVVARAYLDAGSIAETMGRFDKALRYYERASDIYYQDWGAFAPAAWVEEKCEALRRSQPQEAASFIGQELLVGKTVQFGKDGETEHQAGVAW